MSVPRMFINDLANRSFRDVADQDYIAARACFRSGLMIQFAWLAHQAVEKYLKAILLYNGKSSKNLNHHLMKALNRVKAIENLILDLTDPVLKFIEYLDCQGPNRYLEKAHFTKGMEILELDHTVWQIRRYCKVINYEVKLNSGETKNMMEAEINSIHQWLNSENPHKFKINGGHIEEVLKKRDHPQRGNLVWVNFYYGTRKKKKVRVPGRMNTINPTQILYPKYFSEYDKVVQFPKEVREYFMNHAGNK